MTRVATVAFALMTVLAVPAFAQGPAAPATATKPMTEAAKPATPGAVSATHAVVPARKAAPIAAKVAYPAKKPGAAVTTTAPVTKAP
jgi:hypothetical protein